jgi:acetyl-CoA acyltransferase
MAAAVIRRLLDDFPQIDKRLIDDVIVGNAFPEAEQGFNMGRMLSLLALDTVEVPGCTINRYCASGLESIAIAAAKIHSGMADIVLAGGAETMSLVSMGGWRVTPNPDIALKHPKWYLNMGLTSEMVAKEYNISREDQDLFALNSMQKAVKAIDEGLFKKQIVPLLVTENYVKYDRQASRNYTFEIDEGPRRDTNLDALAKLKPAFAADGRSTAGNSSQMSDGAAFVLVVSEKVLKQFNINPLSRFVSYQAAGVEPYKMGIGPVEAIPKVLRHAGLKQEDIDLIELNEAFASQSLAVIRELGLDPGRVNINGGAIALGHPLGATGTKLSVQLLHDMQRLKKRYGMVTMCVGSGQGAAGIFENLS